MSDIWLPGLPPAFTDWSYCTGVLQLDGMDKGNAEILAAIGGPESGYDYRVINDTPSTGDYSVGVWQVNYYGSLYPGRVAQFGTPRQLIEGGPEKQAQAAYDIWRSQGWLAWATTYTSGAWRQYIGSGPVPQPGQPLPGGKGPLPPVLVDPEAITDAIKSMRLTDKQFIWAIQKLERMGVPGWKP